MAQVRTHDSAGAARWDCDRLIAAAAGASGIALGCFFAHSLTALPSGYLAGYVTFYALAATVFLALLGAMLLNLNRTRWLGLGLMVASVLTFATYEIGARALLRFGLVPWHPPAIDLVAGEPARVLIRFKSGVTDQQVNDFVTTKLRFMPNWTNSLEQPTRDSNGRLMLAFTVSETAFGGKRASTRQGKMLAENVSGFMVVMRRDPRVSSVELQKLP